MRSSFSVRHTVRGFRLTALGAASAVLLGGLAGSASAQQNVPFRGGIPVAPSGLENRPIANGPFDYATAEGQNIRVVVVTKAIAEIPYSITFLPDGTGLVTTRGSTVRVLRDGKLEPRSVEGLPAAHFAGTSGLPGAVHGYMDIAAHPQFATNRLVYLSYTKRLDGNRTTTAVGRARWTGSAFEGFNDVFVGDGTSGPTPFVFGRDGLLYVAISGGGDPQDPSDLGGKTLRLNDDGSVPRDNPFVGREGHRPEIFTLGHRNSLGMTVHPQTGDIWQSENGPNGGDEINILRAGRNYGWPTVSFGRTYTGPWQAKTPTHDGFEPPVVFWMPAIAVSGLTFYTGDRLAKWKGDLFVGGLRYGEIPGTGRLDRVLFNENMEELRRETLLGDLGQRVRDVAQSPDGYLYVVTDEDEGAVLRIEPR